MPQIIFAAGLGQEWIEILFFGVAFILWLLGKVFGTNQQPPARRPGQPVQRPPQPPAPGDPLQSEIEEFLRRASGRKEGGAADRAPNRQQPVKTRPPGAKPDPRRPRPAQPTTAQQKPARAEPAVALDTPAGIDQHVKDYLSTSDFDRRRTSLSSIERKEQEFEQQVKQTFAHEVGHLKGSALAVPGEAQVTTAAAPEPEFLTTSSALAGLLASPVTLRSAVLLNEILQRPLNRW